MLTHRAEGSGLEAKTALRGSVLRAISQASAAAHWLLTQESRIGDRELRKPKVRQIPLG
jgi:hypothetical protein